LFFSRGQQSGKEPLAPRDGHHEGLGGLAGAAAPPGQLECRGTSPPAGCDAVRVFGQPLSFYLGDPRLDAAAALHGVVSGQATQTAGTQAFAIALHWAEGHSALKKTAQSACPCGPSLGAMPSCW